MYLPAGLLFRRLPSASSTINGECLRALIMDVWLRHIRLMMKILNIMDSSEDDEQDDFDLFLVDDVLAMFFVKILNTLLLF